MKMKFGNIGSLLEKSFYKGNAIQLNADSFFLLVAVLQLVTHSPWCSDKGSSAKKYKTPRAHLHIKCPHMEAPPVILQDLEMPTVNKTSHNKG